MRIAICDDEVCVLQEVQWHIETICQKINLQVDLHCFQDVKDFEYEIEEMPPYDIAFLDIEIGYQNGIDIAKKVKEKYPATLVAFITGKHHYVYDVFDVQPCGFIRKPIEAKSLEHVLENAVKLCGKMPVFQYCLAGNFYKVDAKDICCVISEKRKIILKTIDGDRVYYGKLDEVEVALQKLSPYFIRIGQSVIVNWNYVRNINYRTVTVCMNIQDDATKEIFNISQKYRNQVREWSLNLSKLA